MQHFPLGVAQPRRQQPTQFIPIATARMPNLPTPGEALQTHCGPVFEYQFPNIAWDVDRH
tara:strand:+ start:1640 stop:1819 length:180 start_codon:yes stop_codon:yes gene_type:complete